MKQILLFAILFFVISAAGVRAQSLEASQYFDNGIRSLEKSQPAMALAYFERSLNSAERSHASPHFRAKIHYNIGVSLYRLDRYDAAADHFGEAIDLYGGNYEKASYALGAANGKMKEGAPLNTQAQARPR